jgi:hypothetical protein
MALVLKDRVKETCTGTSGDMALAGAVSGFVAFDADATFDSNTTYYTLEDADGTKWEVGIGTLSADSTTLTRTTILATQVSFTDTTRQTFSGGTHTIFCGYPAGKSVHLDGSGNLSHTVALTTDTSGNYVATITGGTGIDSDGATTGEGIAHSLSLDLNELSDATLATGDSIVFIDADDNGSKKEAFNDVLDTVAGTVGTTGLDRSGGTLVVSDLHPVGVSGSADQLLTDDGDGTVTSEANLTFDGSTLTTNSGIVRKVATKVDTNYTMTASDHIVLVDTTNANRTITLPAASASNVGQEYTIKKIDGGTGVVNIVPATTGGYGPDDIDEYDTKYVLWVQHDSVTFVCGPGDATAADEQWWITSEKVAPHTCMMTMEGASGTFVRTTPHKVLFDASKHDMGSSGSDANMLTTAGADARITIKRPGRYSITSQILINNTLDAAEHFRIEIYINGAQTFGGSSYQSTTTDQYVYGAVDKTLELTVGDYIQIYFYHNDAADDAEIYNKAEDGSSRTIWDPFVAVNEVSK